jgi:hypothetical protein
MSEGGGTSGAAAAKTAAETWTEARLIIDAWRNACFHRTRASSLSHRMYHRRRRSRGARTMQKSPAPPGTSSREADGAWDDEEEEEEEDGEEDEDEEGAPAPVAAAAPLPVLLPPAVLTLRTV